MMSFNSYISPSPKALTSLSPSVSMDNSASGQKREMKGGRERESKRQGDLRGEGGKVKR